MQEDELKNISNFLFEVGTMRKLLRMHRQTLLTDDLSDNIASHSYRVAIIAWILAKMEKADVYKVIMMAILHDLKEARSGDHNWVHKKYVKIFEDEITEDQLGGLPFSELQDLAKEYEKRETIESHITKDADLLDQILLLKEYAWQGNNEARSWLYDKKGDNSPYGENMQFKLLKTQSAKDLGRKIFESNPSGWWEDLWTHKNR